MSLLVITSDCTVTGKTTKIKNLVFSWIIVQKFK